MTTSRSFAALLLCAVLLAACASEEPRHPGEGHRRGQVQGGQRMPPAPVVSTDVFLFLPYDADHDHRIDKAERDAAIQGAWREIAGAQDTARLLALQDWFQRLEGSAVTPFNPLEFAPDDGETVTRDQFAKALIRRFDALDKNADGVLEPSEFMTVPRVERQGPGEGSGGGPRRHRPDGEAGLSQAAP